MLLQKSLSIDFLKFFCALAIALGHGGGSLLINGHAIVNFYFVVSGYYLMRKFSNTKEINAAQYVYGRLCSLYPHYIFSAFSLFLLLVIFNKSDFYVLLELLKKFIPEIFMLQNTGIFLDGVNFPTWYITALIFSSLLLWQMLKVNKEITINIVCPLVIIGVYTYLHNTDNYFALISFAYLPLLRGLANISIGIITYELATTSQVNLVFKNSFLTNFIGAICLIGFLLSAFSVLDQWLGLIFIIGNVIILNRINILERIFRKGLIYKIVDSFGRLSYPIYLNHLFIIHIFTFANIKLDRYIYKIMFIFVLIVYSYITNFIVKIIIKRIKDSKI
ncbi:hypothetical protein CQ395_03085 [Clostridium neonatale]|uniref:Acyltransferase 3 domain-containing protein n=1 Tax=Clostridium neonatale TaxID=137838 RepID=A0A2A7MMK3_9CLOT|nr:MULTISPECIES: acyltransferase family protein [Clostridium]MDU4847377.1 acyltransferase family protein [Clostridium sp.]PEG28444.1 hypothetical protein CQ395_03085 [Clostridium neonatale]PEG32591.1 hypothetical protein CQ394_13115 [Clostridium neonatale]CAH0438851.1 Putative membrane protein [Clostridium neonatale]